MGTSAFRMIVRRGISGIGDNPDGLQLQFLEADQVTPAEIFSPVEFRAVFPVQSGLCEQVLTLTEPNGVTVDRVTGSITVPVTTTTFDTIHLDRRGDRRGQFAITHQPSPTERLIILDGEIFIEGTAYVQSNKTPYY